TPRPWRTGSRYPIALPHSVRSASGASPSPSYYLHPSVIDVLRDLAYIIAHSWSTAHRCSTVSRALGQGDAEYSHSLRHRPSQRAIMPPSRLDSRLVQWLTY